MLQCNLGLELRPGGHVTFTQVQDAYSEYAAMRHPHLPPEPLSIADIIQTARALRDMVGYGRDLQEVVYTHEHQTFYHMAACVVE